MQNFNIEALCSEIRQEAKSNFCEDIIHKCEQFIDATSLNVTDSEQSIKEFTQKMVSKYPNIATICVSPIHIETVGISLEDSPIGITATIGGFPLGQTFIEVKMLECSMAIENGADEVDFVIDVAAMNSGKTEIVKSQIEGLIEEIDGQAITKAILECGAIKDLETLHIAAITALEAGADFIKTSTGKNCQGATLEAFVIMSLAIKSHFEQYGVRRGIKVAGGVRTAEDVNLYYTAVKNILGKQWLTSDLFRIGASSILK